MHDLITRSPSQLRTSPNPESAHSARPNQVLLVVYMIAVLTISAVLSYGAWTSAPTTVASPMGWTPVGWSPSVETCLVWTLGLASLTLVPFCPAIGVAVFVITMYGFPRNQPALEYAHLHDFDLWILGITCVGQRLAAEGVRSSGVLLRYIPIWPLIGLLAWVTISTFAATLRGDYWPVYPAHHPLQFACAGLAFFTAASTLRVRRDILIVAAALVVSVFAHDLLWPGLTLTNNDFAAIVAIAFPIVVAAATTSRRWEFSVGYGLAAAGCLWLIFQTEVRGAALGVVGATITLWLGTRQKIRIAALAAPLIACGAIYFSTTHYWQRFSTEIVEDGEFIGSAGSRIEIWEAGYELYQQQPVFGSGPGTFIRRLFISYPDIGRILAHNSVIELLVETGFPGAILFVTTFAAGLIVAWYSLMQQRTEFTELAVSLSAGLVAYLIVGFFLSRQDLPLAYLILGYVIASVRGSVGPVENARVILQGDVVQIADRSVHRIESLNADPAPLAAPHDSTAKFFGILSLVAISALVVGSLVPFQYEPVPWDAAVTAFLAMMEGGPLFELGGGGDWALNFLLTIPIAYCGMGWQLAGRTSVQRVACIGVLIAAATMALSVVVEFSQIWFSGRVPSRNDIGAQWYGALTGVGLWCLSGRRLTAWCQRWSTTRSPAAKVHAILQVFVAVVVAYTILPLELVTSVDSWLRQFDRESLEIVPFSNDFEALWQRLIAYAVKLLVAVPIGFWSASSAMMRGSPATTLQSAWRGIAVIVGIELIQLLALTQPASSGDIILGIVGVAIGAGYWRHATSTRGRDSDTITLPTRSGPWILGFFGYTVALAAVLWAPYDFQSDSMFVRERLQEFLTVPFARLQSGSDIQAVLGLVRKFFCFLPMGALAGIAVATGTRDRGPTRATSILIAIAAIVVAVGLESIRVLQPNKTADLASLLIVGAAVVASFVIAIRIALHSRQHR